MKKNIILAVVLSIFIFTSCDDPASPPASLITIEQLKQDPGYQWFNDAYYKYQANDSLVQLIEEKFKSTKDSFVVYVKPSCSCSGTLNEFPALIKIFDAAGVNSTQYKLFSMTSDNAQHPYQDIFKINMTPALLTIRNGSTHYSVLDTFYLYRKLQKPRLIEEILLDALN